MKAKTQQIMMAKFIPALKSVLVVCAVVAAVFGVVYMLRLNIAARSAESGDTSFVARNMRIRVWKGDTVKWEIRARKVIISPDENFYEIHDIYDGKLITPEKTYRFTAKDGKYDSVRKRVEFEGRTVFRATKGGDYFKARKVLWRGNIERLEMSSGVEASHDGNIIKAQNLVANGERLDNFVLSGGVAIYIPDVSKSKTFGAELKESDLKARDVRRILLHAARVDYNGTNKNLRCYAEEPVLSAAALQQQLLQPPGMAQQPVSPGFPEAQGLPDFSGGAIPPGLPTLPGLPTSPPLMPHVEVPPPGMDSGLVSRMPLTTLPPPPGLTPAPLVSPNAVPLKNPVTLNSRGLSIAAREIFVDYKYGKFARAVGSVRIVRSGRRPEKSRQKAVQAVQKRTTTVLADEAEYFWREGRMQALGFVSIKQKDMDITAGSVVMYTKDDRAELRGGVTLHQKKGEWLIKDKVVGKDATDDTKDAAREETTIYCSALDIDFSKDTINATGNINVRQKNRSLTASTAEYDGTTRIWRVFGGVRAVNKDDEFTAPLLEYNEKTGEYTAISGGTALVKPKDDDQGELRDFFSDRDEDFKAETFKKEKAAVSAARLHYDEKKNILTAEGRAKMDFKDVVLSADKLVVRYDDKNARGDKNITIRDKYTTITGDWFTADWQRHEFTVGGNVKLSYEGRPESAKKKKVEPFELTCGLLEYDSEKRLGRASGGPVITAKNRRAASEILSFNLKDEIYVLDGAVKLHQDNGDWLKDKDYIDADDKQAQYLSEKPTDVTCAFARFENDRDYVLLRGAVKLSQKEKTVRTGRLEFFGKDKRLVMTDDVFMEQSNGEWLFEGGFIEDDEDEDLKTRARDQVEITADKVESQYGERKMNMTGNVLVRQGASEASGRSLWYYGKEKLTVIEGDVQFRDEDGRDLAAARIVHDGKKKELEAFNSIKGSSLVDKNKK